MQSKFQLLILLVVSPLFYAFDVGAAARGFEASSEASTTSTENQWGNAYHTVIESEDSIEEKVGMIAYLHQMGEDDINGEDADGYTPLMLAIISGDENKRLVQELLKHPGIDACRRDGQDCTPLHDAAEYDCPEIIVMLFERLGNLKSDLCKSNYDGHTPLHIAAKHESTRAIKTLIGLGAEVDPRDDLSRTPLLLAAEKGKLGSMIVLVAKGADKTAKSKEGNVFWHALCGKSGLAVHLAYKFLYRNGGFETLKSNVYRKHLRLACLKATCGIVEDLFVITKARLRCRNSKKRILLHLAVDNPDTGVLSYLIKRASELGILKQIINYNDNLDGRTPLHEALYARHFEHAAHLLEAGADAQIIDKKKRTALHAFLSSLVLEKNQEAAERLLPLLLSGKEGMRAALLKVPIGSMKASALDIIATLGYLPIVARFTDADGTTFLHLVAHAGLCGAAKALLGAGANPCARDASGRFPHEVEEEFIVDDTVRATIAILREAFDVAIAKGAGKKKRKKKKKKGAAARAPSAASTVISIPIVVIEDDSSDDLDAADPDDVDSLPLPNFDDVAEG